MNHTLNSLTRLLIVVFASLTVGCGGGGSASGSLPVNGTSATTGEPILVDLSRSTLTVNKFEAVADGSDQIVATFTARDQQGSPVSGLAIGLEATGAGNSATRAYR